MLEDDGAPLDVIVYSQQGRSVGFIVDEILDAVEETITSRQSLRGYDGMTSIVVHGKVTDLLDVHALIRREAPMFYDNLEAA